MCVKLAQTYLIQIKIWEVQKISCNYHMHLQLQLALISNFNSKHEFNQSSNLPISRSNLGTPSSGKASNSSALSDNCAFQQNPQRHQVKNLIQKSFPHPPHTHGKIKISVLFLVKEPEFQ